MKRRSKIILVVIALVLCCVASVIGATYGLLYETFSTRNHLIAGSLKVTLVRQRLISKNIDSNGNMRSVIDDSVKDFTSSTQDNIFGIGTDTLLVPGSSFTAEMNIGNNGNVAFYYYVEVIFNSVISDSEFASMLKFSVESANGVKKETLIKDGLTLGENDQGLGLVQVGASESFTVKLEFLDDDKNNNVENKFVIFDLLVHVEQQVNEN